MMAARNEPLATGRIAAIPLLLIAASIGLVALMDAPRQDSQGTTSLELDGRWEWALADGCTEALSFKAGDFSWTGESSAAKGKVVHVRALDGSEFKEVGVQVEGPLGDAGPCKSSSFLRRFLAGQKGFYLLDLNRAQMLICESRQVSNCAGPFLRSAAR